MYGNFTFATAGELSASIGRKISLTSDTINLSTYKDLDGIRITASQLRLQYVLDQVDPSRVLFDDMDANETGLISSLMYRNSGPIAICNKRYATATKRRDDEALRFSDTIDGHICALHGLLRLLFAIHPPIDALLGHAHHLFTTILYSLMIRAFNRDYSIITFSEQKLAALRYACASISAYKHFEMDGSPNDAAITATSLIFNRVNPNYYNSIHNPINNFEIFAEYLDDRAGLKGIDRGTIINQILRQLGYRALVILECGVDMIIDSLLSKSINHIISNNLFKIIGIKHYEELQLKFTQLYNQMLTQGGI